MAEFFDQITWLRAGERRGRLWWSPVPGYRRFLGPRVLLKPGDEIEFEGFRGELPARLRVTNDGVFVSDLQYGTWTYVDDDDAQALRAFRAFDPRRLLDVWSLEKVVSHPSRPYAIGTLDIAELDPQLPGDYIEWMGEKRFREVKITASKNRIFIRQPDLPPVSGYVHESITRWPRGQRSGSMC